MSDPNDPFAAQPYFPPSKRDEDSPPGESTPEPTSSAPETPAPERDDVVSAPEEMSSSSEPPEPPHDDAPSAASDSSSTHEMPAVTERLADDDREPTVVLPTDSGDDGT